VHVKRPLFLVIFRYWRENNVNAVVRRHADNDDQVFYSELIFCSMKVVCILSEILSDKMSSLNM